MKHVAQWAVLGVVGWLGTASPAFSQQSPPATEQAKKVEALVTKAAALIDKNGKAALVLAAESLTELQQLVQINNLFISRICRVKPNPQKSVFRILVEICGMECTVAEEELIIEFETHFDYTPEYREITKDFYLKF